MHELIADAPAIGALEDFHHAPRRGGFEAHHTVDEDGLVHVFLVEAIEAGVELGVGFLGRDLERIEIGFEMADHAIGAHHVNGADGFLGGRAKIVFRGAALFGARLQLAGERGNDFAVLQLQLGVAPPAGPAAELGRRKAGFAQFGEEGPPAVIHRIGVLLVLGIELFDEGGVGAIQERGEVQNLVGGPVQSVRSCLACHFNRLAGWPPVFPFAHRRGGGL